MASLKNTILSLSKETASSLTFIATDTYFKTVNNIKTIDFIRLIDGFV